MIVGIEALPELTKSRIMSESIDIIAKGTEELDATTRAAIINVCIMAHQEEDFRNLFTYIPAGGTHFLAYRGQALVSHAVVTTRWLQPEGQPCLRTAYLDAVATLPAYQRQGIGSTFMRHLALGIADYDIGCLETDRQSFYAQVGWEEWRGPLAGRKGTELLPIEPKAFKDDTKRERYSKRRKVDCAAGNASRNAWCACTRSPRIRASSAKSVWTVATKRPISNVFSAFTKQAKACVR